MHLYCEDKQYSLPVLAKRKTKIMHVLLFVVIKCFCNHKCLVKSITLIWWLMFLCLYAVVNNTRTRFIYRRDLRLLRGLIVEYAQWRAKLCTGKTKLALLFCSTSLFVSWSIVVKVQLVMHATGLCWIPCLP